MKKRKIYSLVLGSILLLAVFSVLIYAKPFSNTAKNSEKTEQKIEDEDSQTEFETPEDTEELDSGLDQDPEGFEGSDAEDIIDVGKIKLQVYYSTIYSLPNLPVQYATVILESEDGTIQRKGITNIRGRTTFRFLPTEHNYIIQICKDDTQIAEEFIAMKPDIKTNYAIAFF